MNRITEAELIELENWVLRLHRRFRKADRDEEKLDGAEWTKKYPEMPWSSADRVRVYETLLAIIEVARESTGHPNASDLHTSAVTEVHQ